ncbi:MAG: hypothetical protein ACHQ2Z_09765 [Elusimicrobiota bacterium]
MRLIPLAALLSAFFFAGCAAGGGAPAGGAFGAMTKPAPASSGSPCPPGTIFQNGQCVAYGGAKY